MPPFSAISCRIVLHRNSITLMRLLAAEIIILFACAISMPAAERGGSDPPRTFPAYSNPLKLDLHIPARHPYLALTPADIERAKERVSRLAWAKLVYTKLLTDAGHYVAEPLGKLPDKDDTKHWNVAGRLFSVGVAYTLSGEKRFAEWTRDGLLAYADLYPKLPLTNGRCKVFRDESLYEAMWVVQIAQAYDLVADSGVFTPEQARRVENDLLRAALVCFRVDDFQNDPRIKDLHYRCYNFQAWHLSAIGLIGLAIRDPASVDYAINSPYGFRHLVAHDIRDDGLFWERSVGYHKFVLDALLPLAEAMAHCGVDLYGMTVPNDRTPTDDAHYVTDTTDAPKSLRLMFEAPLYLAFPDLSYPALGDSDRGPLKGTWQELVGFARYHDVRLAGLLERDAPRATAPAETAPRRSRADWQWLVYDLPEASAAGSPVLPLHDGSFANSGEYRNGCSLFPASGLAVLRQAGADFTNHRESTAVSFSYGPHGGGHGHPDKMNIVVYAQGRQWIPDFGSMPYETHWKAEWTAQTVSHNTVVVDGTSQQPTGARNPMWPTDDSENRVIGKLERFDPEAKFVSASCRRAYPGFTLRRAVRLAASDVVDDFVAAPEASVSGDHQFDYVLHIDGKLANSSIPMSLRSGKLGETYGYQYIDAKQAGTAGQPASFTFASDVGELRVWIVPSDAVPAQVILGEGLTNSPEGRMAVLILRRKAPRARFLSVIEPVNGQDPILSVRLERTREGELAALVIERASGARRNALQ